MDSPESESQSDVTARARPAGRNSRRLLAGLAATLACWRQLSGWEPDGHWERPSRPRPVRSPSRPPRAACPEQGARPLKGPPRPITAGASQGYSSNAATTVRFAIPVTAATSVVDQINSGQSSSQTILGHLGYLGVSVSRQSSSGQPQVRTLTGRSVTVTLDSPGRSFRLTSAPYFCSTSSTVSLAVSESISATARTSMFRYGFAGSSRNSVHFGSRRRFFSFRRVVLSEILTLPLSKTNQRAVTCG